MLGFVRADRRTRTLVIALFAFDALCIAYYLVSRTLHELARSPWLYEQEALLVTTEGGLPEGFNYAQAGLVVVLCLRLARATRQPVYAAVALFYAVVALDDALQIHESVGARLAHALDLRPWWGVAPQSLGEVLCWAALGAPVVLLFLVGLARSSAPHHRANGHAFVLAALVLLGCAILVDALYGVLHDVFPLAGTLMDALEDGGEMLALSFACALAFGTLLEVRAGSSGARGAAP